MIDALFLQKTVEQRVRRFKTRDPQQLAEASHILLYQKDLGSLLGLYFLMNRRRFIILSNRLTDEQRTMVLAHELGHDALHRDRARKHAFHDLDLTDLKDSSEYEANAFAAHLLLDTDEFLDYARLYSSDYRQLSCYFHCSPQLVLIKINELIRLGYPLRLPETPDAYFLREVENRPGD